MMPDAHPETQEPMAANDEEILSQLVQLRDLLTGAVALLKTTDYPETSIKGTAGLWDLCLEARGIASTVVDSLEQRVAIDHERHRQTRARAAKHVGAEVQR
jgi:hypothetical protein